MGLDFYIVTKVKWLHRPYSDRLALWIENGDFYSLAEVRDMAEECFLDPKATPDELDDMKHFLVHCETLWSQQGWGEDDGGRIEVSY